jgi:hypothetical protein
MGQHPFKRTRRGGEEGEGARWVRCHAARLGEGPGEARAVAADRQEPGRSGNGLVARPCAVVRDRGDRGVDRWAQGHSNGWRGQNGLKTFKIFQILIDPNVTFLSSKNLK